MHIAFPHPPGIGGPGSFQTRLEFALKSRGWQISYASNQESTAVDILMVVGGTRRFFWLHKMRRRGVPIVHRLDGLLWLHRTRGFFSEPKRWLGSEIRNGMAQWIHANLAQTVIYQSHFVRNWWLEQGWVSPKNWKVIHNGIDLDQFRPGEVESTSLRPPDVVCVEGTIDYSPYAIALLNSFAGHVKERGADLIVYGGFSEPGKQQELSTEIDYRGSVTRDQVATVYRNRVYLSLDVNPACPNAVAEAMASGAPVIGFDTGAVSELVGESAGHIVPFGGDPWIGEWPAFDNLNSAYDRTASAFETLSLCARQRAVNYFDIDDLVNAYILVFEDAMAS